MGSATFIEAPVFTSSVSLFGSDANYAGLQRFLIENPKHGRVVTGAAPLRKIRWEDVRRGKGKRGGLRITYIHVEEVDVFVMLDVFDKDEREDLSQAEKKELRSLARQIVDLVLQGHRRPQT